MDPSQACWRDIAQRYRQRAVTAETQRDRLVALFRKSWGPGCTEHAAGCPACDVESEFREITGFGFADIEKESA